MARLAGTGASTSETSDSNTTGGKPLGVPNAVNDYTSLAAVATNCSDTKLQPTELCAAVVISGEVAVELPRLTRHRSVVAP